MAWRFKASKYKNAAPIVPKPENFVRDISVGSYQTYGNNIKASAKFMAFNWDHTGSSLAVLPLDDSGRKSKLMPLLHAHSDTVTDMDFSPFDDGLLATGSQDCLVKIWHIPKEGLQESLSNPECVFSHKQRRVETVGFHPTANFLLHSTSYTTLTLWDLLSEQELFSNSDHGEVIQSVSWKSDGTLVATSCKDKQVRILDPRIENSCIKTASSHAGIKDSRIVWLGEQNRVLTTGFDAQRLRQIIIRDVRNFSEPEKTLELDCSTGILIPLYDADTGMLFLAGKGDTTIGYMEVSDKEPYLIEGIRHSGEQTKGACLVPKRALNVMQGEVNRILQLTSSSVIPITYQVPRKTYRDFHSDIYPDTPGYKTELTATEWLEGKNLPLVRISLDPAKRENGEQPIVIYGGSLQDMKEEQKNNLKSNPKVVSTSITEVDHQSVTSVSSIVKDLETDQKQSDNLTDINSLFIKNETEYQQNEKPRLGPKPFSPPKLNDTENAFSKVFSVPLVPGQSHNGFHSEPSVNKVTTPETSVCKVTTPVEEREKEKTPTSDTDTPPVETSKSGSSGEDEPSGDSGYMPKTPSTAERRKIFETQSNSKDNELEENLDAGGQGQNFERASLQRSSIAERRRIYENRSVSVQEQGSVQIEKEESPLMLRRKDSFKSRKNTDSAPEDTNRKSVPNLKQQSLDPVVSRKSDIPILTPKRTSTVFGRVSKFRHLKGTPAHKSQHLENVRNISRQISGECDGFHANPERVAVPLSGPGGKIAIFELSKTGRLPDGVIPALVHGNNIMDFTWDPFDNHHLAVACDDGLIKLWKVPDGGLTEPTSDPETEFNAHTDKIYFIKYHPSAKAVLASGSYDMTIKIWDLTTLTEQIVLHGHTDQMFSFAWSPCGAYCATVSKDDKVRIYKPRQSNIPIRQGKGPEGNRGARIVWALDGRFIVVTGFDKVSERQIMVYDPDSLESPLTTLGLDVSPAILIPFYDEGSSTLFVTGKGDSTIYAYEITEEAPFVCPLSHHRCGTLHQGLSFLPKNVCDVSSVEFAKALRLTNNSIEPLSFTVPRLKMDLFQDDLFPPTRITWVPTLSSSEWFSGKDKLPQRISLQPEGMEALSVSQNQSNSGVERTLNKSASTPFIEGSYSYTKISWDVDVASQAKSKQDEIKKSVSSRLEMDLRLEQDEMEGVDEKEWNE